MSKYIILLLVLFSPLIAKAQDVSLAIDPIFAAYQNSPGIAIAVVKDGETLFQKGYGLANLSYDVPVTTKTTFDVASNAQQFTAACIFLLEQEGKLDLDAPIQEYIPDFPVYEGDPITIRHLLYQTSGLRSHIATLYSKNQYWGDSFDNDDVINLLKQHTGLNFLPGTNHYYSEANYVLLASIIERVSGTSFTTYARENVFVPLGMKDTFFREDKDQIINNLAIGYEAEGDQFRQLHYHNNTIVGDKGLNTTIEDFVRWSNSLTTGSFWGEDFIEQMIHSGMLSSGDDIRYANGLYHGFHYDMEEMPRMYHSGYWAGFRSLYYNLPMQGLVIIILSNNANTNVWALLDQLTPLFLANEIEQAQQAMNTRAVEEIQPLSLSEAEKERFSGKFYSTLNGYLRQISLDGDQLVYIRPGANPTPLVAISPNELVYEHAPQVKFTFDNTSFNSMVVTINDLDPTPYQKYDEITYGPSELMQFEKSYYSEDIDEILQIVALEKDLQILVKDEAIAQLTPIAEDLFTSEHWGYIVFERNADDTITGFTRYDDHLYNLKHTVVEDQT